IYLLCICVIALVLEVSTFCVSCYILTVYLCNSSSFRSIYLLCICVIALALEVYIYCVFVIYLLCICVIALVLEVYTYCVFCVIALVLACNFSVKWS
ncbi:hypothetical protein LOTGIDRAFT_147461, partial [Lottia gigantea]